MTLTPAASAAGASPFSSARCARCAATSDDEHAVSVDTHGPDRPSAYDTLRPTCARDIGAVAVYHAVICGLALVLDQHLPGLLCVKMQYAPLIFFCASSACDTITCQQACML